MCAKKPARGHHYIPRMYLKGFARNPGKKSKLFVFDFDKSDWLPGATNPVNIAKVRDFNRVDIEGLPIDALEMSLSEFETQSRQDSS